MKVEQCDKIVLYGTGLEGEKFYCRYAKQCEIVYCLDRRKRECFHGKKVYSLDEKKNDLEQYYIVVAVGPLTYENIKIVLEQYGLMEYKNFIYVAALGKKICFLYGNCHMRALERYLNTNPFFVKLYYTKSFDITYKAPAENELDCCYLLITQDIRQDNYLGKPSSDELIRRHAVGANIVVPNLYGYNMFFPQIDYNSCYKDVRQKNAESHLLRNAIDIDTLGEAGKNSAHDFAYMAIGCGDAYIDAMYHMGYTIADIKNNILNKEILTEKEIRDKFNKILLKIKEREKECDFEISDFIENHYQKLRLFYSPSHPTGAITKAKGERVLELLGIEPEKEIYFDNGLGADEIPIYGCVKRALGLEFEQEIYRKESYWTLTNEPVDLEGYIVNYVIWAWGYREN